jgi:tetratricopeptide (TPR) repeat protein
MARFKQGDLLRRLNQFGAAQQVYELLVRDFSRHPDVRAAELALADCHAAQAATDASHLESAISIYERLQDQVAADVDLRVESGFKHGHALVRTQKIERAQEVWWPVVNAFLLNEAEARRLGANGRHWMARILVELASLHEQQGKLEQARDLYELAVKSGLPYGEAVRSRLARLRGGEVAPNR